MTPPGSPKRVAFDEYKLYYESTEKVTDRRLAANNWNYTVCVATLVAIAALANWGLARVSVLSVALLAIGILCIMAVLFCSLWIGQIRDFKVLNNAKFKVLNSMAPAVCFSEKADDTRVSFDPFSVEWIELQRANAVNEINNSDIVALRSSNIEFLIPRTFRVLFVVILVAVCVAVAANWATLLNASQLSVETDARGKATLADSAFINVE